MQERKKKTKTSVVLYGSLVQILTLFFKTLSCCIAQDDPERRIFLPQLSKLWFYRNPSQAQSLLVYFLR